MAYSWLFTRIAYFYPRSPCGERLPRFHADAVNAVFLSTLSLRRATHGLNAQNLGNIISIHALLAESDAVGVILLS